MAILNATHLKKYYGSGESLVKALDDINVSVAVRKWNLVRCMRRKWVLPYF